MMAWIVWNLGKISLGALSIAAAAYGLSELGFPTLKDAVMWVLGGDQPLVAIAAIAASRVVGGAVYLLAGGDDM